MVTEEGATLDDAMIASGGFGKYQWFLLSFYIMAFTSANFLLYNIDPLTDDPVYLCEVEGTEPPEYYDCTAEEICESNFTIPYKIDTDNVDSLDNWVETLDLMCVPRFKIYRISWVYYLGEIFGCLVVSRIPDLFGRKLVLAICNAIQFPVFLAVIFSRSLELTTFLGFLMGVLHKNIYDGAYINISEYFQTKWKTHMSTVLLVFDMLS
jgi:MFS family permease